MGHKWIIDVLADLESFACKNGLPLVADRMREAAIVASAEIASSSEGPLGHVRYDAEYAEPLFAGAGNYRPS
ncbi:hypothetical protein ACOI1H_01775 [Loktanella sp. DJP18]|uniref:hypothetical protein n=1 Tax=Loktanella sp. DJP18 TaxID=3409788 RepID=UPI003BB57205